MDPILEVISGLFKDYGLPGLAFGGLLALLYRNKTSADARISQLEKRDDENQEKQLDEYKEVIGQYVALVKGNTEVLAKLTSCLESMNSTLLRLESRKRDEK